MIVVTANRVSGKRIVRTLGLVRGNSIRTRHIGKDIMAVFRNIVGGEVAEYTKLLGESREQALDRMVEEATSLGGNATSSVRFSTSMIMGAAAELLAYGTAVVLEDDPGTPRSHSPGTRTTRCAAPLRQRHSPSRFGAILLSPCSVAHRSSSGVARSSTSGSAKPSTRRSTDLRYRRQVWQASMRMCASPSST